MPRYSYNAMTFSVIDSAKEAAEGDRSLYSHEATAA